MHKRAASNAASRCGAARRHDDRRLTDGDRPGAVQEGHPSEVRPARAGLVHDRRASRGRSAPRRPRTRGAETSGRPSAWSRAVPVKVTTAPQRGARTQSPAVAGVEREFSEPRATPTARKGAACRSMLRSLSDTGPRERGEGNSLPGPSLLSPRWPVTRGSSAPPCRPTTACGDTRPEWAAPRGRRRGAFGAAVAGGGLRSASWVLATALGRDGALGGWAPRWWNGTWSSG